MSEWTREDETDFFAKGRKRDPFEIPGPSDLANASHGCVENAKTLMIETWAHFGPDKSFRLKTRQRPMTESEIILMKVRGHSRHAVLKAFGVDEPSPRTIINHEPSESLIQRFLRRVQWGN